MSIPVSVTRTLEQASLLLEADAELPSIASLVAGEPIRGSWWAHPLAHEIYDVCVAVDHRDDVVTVKLLKGKVTHVARALWPALLTVGLQRAPWQSRGLNADAQTLLRRVSREGETRLDQIRWRGKRKPGVVARELEARLLVFSEEFHTEQGRHAKSLVDWNLFRRRHRLAPMASLDAAQRVLEDAAMRLDARAPGALPWR
ncbi:MAG: hypothetical protein V3U43_10670 [Pseudomonadales bacterium]